MQEDLTVGLEVDDIAQLRHRKASAISEFRAPDNINNNALDVI
jgi:hypothetical protein